MKRITIVGLGNIGSYLVELAARMADVGVITLVDFDSYEAKNVLCQSIDTSDLGPKVRVQARRLRRINPQLSVRPLCARVEDVPLGLLRADVILAGLDSRAGRRVVNRAAWRLGIPWVDAAVDRAGLLVRVAVYVPGDDAPCAECADDDADLALLEQEYKCDGGAAGAPATNAPASLGAMAAGLMAVECQKLLDGDRPHVLAGRQVFMDLRHHVQDVTTYRRQGGCKFDHRVWPTTGIAAAPSQLALADLFRMAACDGGPSTGWAVRLEGHTFARTLFCPGCGGQSDGPLAIVRRIPSRRRRCAACGHEMVARGFDCFDLLEETDLEKRDCRRSLASLGLRAGDIVTVRGPEGEWHAELGSGSTGCAGPPCVPCLAGEGDHD
jgi:molybdopterin/thiamine biosynthesis adenylyltransferase